MYTLAKHFTAAVISALAAAALAGSASAAAIVLTFEGVGDLNSVGNFYNGGAGGNLGISFSPTSLALVDADAGGSGNIGGEPSPDTVLFFLDGGAATMTVAGGFTTGFSFFYSSINLPASVSVYDGPNGTGNILASLTLPVTPFNGAPDPSGFFSPLVPIGVSFSGTAQSVDFGGSANQVVFDDVTIGSVTPGNPVPDAGATLSLLGLAFSGLVLMKKKTK